jgi:hypothetical protein
MPRTWLWKQKFRDELAEMHRLPLVCPPLKAHPRYLPCWLLLNLSALDSAIRRSLLVAPTGGAWLPPPEPVPVVDTLNQETSGGSANSGGYPEPGD